MDKIIQNLKLKPHPEGGFFRESYRSTGQINKDDLFSIMSHFGFTHYPMEWWHFDFTGWKNDKLMDLSFEDMEKATK